jgi:glutathione S-transferase
VEPRLCVLTASHPCIAVELMLRRKGLEYRRVELPLILSRGILRAMRFPRKTVPAMRLAERRLQGSRAISRAVDELRPDPPCFHATRARASWLRRQGAGVSNSRTPRAG